MARSIAGEAHQRAGLPIPDRYLIAAWAITYGAALLTYAYRLSSLRNEARHLGDMTRRLAS